MICKKTQKYIHKIYVLMYFMTVQLTFLKNACLFSKKKQK